MSAAGRGFGFNPRQGRGANRKQPSGARWDSVSTKSPTARAVESLNGPLPDKREKVERKFTTHCALHLGHPRKAAPKKVELNRHLFNLVRMVDGTAAIQPYVPDDPVNSICHAMHATFRRPNADSRRACP